MIWDLTSFKAVRNSVLVDCWVRRIVSQYPPNFSYVEVNKTMGLNSPETRGGNLVRVHRKSLRTLILERRGLI